jgi:spastic paraplegia protein 7
MPASGRVVFLLWLVVVFYIFMNLTTPDEVNVHHVSWNEFVYDYLAHGEVESIVVRPEAEVAYLRLQPGAVIRGKKAEDGTHVIKIAEISRFEEKLRKVQEELGILPANFVPVVYQRELSWVTAAITLVVVGLAMMLFRNVVKFQLPNPTQMFASERKAKFVRVDLQTLQGKGIKFTDVAGLHEAKVEIMEFVDYLKKPENYRVLGAKVPRGALMLGPPGCGKTLLAKAVATEARVPFLAMAGSEFVEMLGGLLHPSYSFSRFQPS